MDDVRHWEQADRAEVEQLLGYVNFSNGVPDPSFQRNLNNLFEICHSRPDETAAACCAPLYEFLHAQLLELHENSSAFRDIEQAEHVLKLALLEFPPAYRKFHRDLLRHQTDASLFTSLFVARVFEAVLAQGPPWSETRRVLRGARQQLNDFLGHRPLAVLENERQVEPYPKERVRPVPIYLREVGPASCRYRPVLEHALAILRETDSALLSEADFDLDLMDELAFDPRAYDFGHPVNQRPNYQFGEWDPHHLDNSGRHRRFVIRQVTLDAVMERLKDEGIAQDELLFEAGAVLAGVILMASGTSGRGPGRHDSGVTLSTLLPRIAGYRDHFYDDLLQRVGPQHRQRLEEEMERTRQPFGAARQHLNRYLARQRAVQMQHVELARLFAEMGFPEASRRQASMIAVPRARFLSEVLGEITSAHLDLDAGRLQEAAQRLPQIEGDIHRAIECGAFVDPWNILGFGGHFSIFPAVENSVHDPRIDELTEMMERTFSLYVRTTSAAGAAGEERLGSTLVDDVEKLAEWWDQFASTEVSSVQGVSGREARQSATQLRETLTAYRQAGVDAGDLGFWREHIEKFHSPKSYALAVESLLDKKDFVAAMALLIQWVSQAEQVPFSDGEFSFYALTLRWMQGGWRPLEEGKPRDSAAFPTWQQVRKFFDYLEANAEEYWGVPGLEIGSKASDLPDLFDPRGDDRDESDEDNLFEAAYEGVSFRDSTADGIEGEMAEFGPAPPEADEWTAMADWMTRRLRFLAMLADLWRVGVAQHLQPDGLEGVRLADPNGTAPEEELLATLQGWVKQARGNMLDLFRLLEAVLNRPIPAPSSSTDSRVEYENRRRTQIALSHQVLTALVATHRAVLTIYTALPRAEAESLMSDHRCAGWEKLTVGLHRMMWCENRDEAKDLFADLITCLAEQPLLYVPIEKGGQPGKVVQVQLLQQVLRDLLHTLPRASLLDATYTLLQMAREMERRHPVGARAVTEFDRLYQNGLMAILVHVIACSETWKDGEHVIDALQVLTEALLREWLQHSQSLRLSTMERLRDEKQWERLVQFIRSYGSELFTPRFFHLGNLQAILHQGVPEFLETVEQDPELVDEWRLLSDMGITIDRDDVVEHLELVLEAIVENYEEYKDYNSITTQSDSGENLHMLLDFLRLKSSYERVVWNLRPLAIVHEALVREGKTGAAEKWRRLVAEKSVPAARMHLNRLRDLERKYGMQLPTIRDRIGEQFMKSFQLSRIRALIRPAVEDARAGRKSPAFELLEQELEVFTLSPSGAGLDLPYWLIALDEEVRRTNPTTDLANRLSEWVIEIPRQLLSWDEMQEELIDWSYEEEDEDEDDDEDEEEDEEADHDDDFEE